MNQLFLRDLRLEAQVGIYKRERMTTQPISLDLDIELPNERVFATGKVADTIDYAVVVQRIRAVLEARRFGLVEELAAHIAQLLLDEFQAPWVRVSVAKLGILKGVARAGIVIERPRRSK
jgi:dihydroneopterin aldolase